jgi:hypothetical protein
LVAVERRRAKVRHQRADWFKHRLPAIATWPDRVVFIDETAVKTNLTRLRGRAKRGQRLTMDASFGSWGTQTLIAGLAPGALIAPWVIKGAMNGPAFAAYVREVLVSEIEPGTVVILDNLANQKKQGSGRGPARAWLLVPLPAAIFARPESYRTGVPQTESPSPPDRSKDLHRQL